MYGVPSIELIQYANENNNKLVVIGNRGLNALQEIILGSVSLKS
ncbi:universal stress protein [Kurthia senegalensis]|nr:universal stress protein [Kurthia senegalensis]